MASALEQLLGALPAGFELSNDDAGFAPNTADTIAALLGEDENFAPNTGAMTLPPNAAAMTQDPITPVSDAAPLFGPPPYLQTEQPQAAAAQQGQGIQAKLAAILQGLSQPNGTQYGNGVPRPSDLDQLLGLGAALIGGGDVGDYLGRAADISSFQQVRSMRESQIGQQFQYNQARLDDISPAGQLRKQQQQFYASRMANDVNRYIEMIGNDVNGVIPDEERDRIWNQIAEKYGPLGLNPGPAPSQIQQWNAEQGSPEFRNAKMVENFRGEFGESAANVVAAMLQSGSSPEKVADFQIKMETIKAANQQAMMKTRDDRIKEIKGQIENERKRDLEMHRNAGIQGMQLTKDFDRGLVSQTGRFATMEAAINNYHDSRLVKISQGENPGPSLFANGIANVEDEKQYEQLSTTIGNIIKGSFQSSTSVPGQARPASNDGVPVFPAHSAIGDLSALPDDVKSRAVNVDDPRRAAEVVAKANRENVAILVLRNGELRMLRPSIGQ